ncbi:hypothetical protein FRB94_011175 [Tulasnella sp. JGI-2019a]|nr:hypothetical protein FRB93_009913 [Tulasnella sp. JGI-2019a]KAG8992937.1 hypothetical protein FRB94_011175 [Tulasnella sp. JGI-2019a]KAG9024572.1 hypothetical protein FRB95_011339 [Tulasnella sp. JGI-2019a]
MALFSSNFLPARLVHPTPHPYISQLDPLTFSSAHINQSTNKDKNGPRTEILRWVAWEIHRGKSRLSSNALHMVLPNVPPHCTELAHELSVTVCTASVRQLGVSNKVR